jgi:hypothetical protein
MPKGGWEDLDKACPNRGCAGLLLLKALGEKHLAVRCTHGDFEKRDSAAKITAWLADR